MKDTCSYLGGFFYMG